MPYDQVIFYSNGRNQKLIISFWDFNSKFSGPSHVCPSQLCECQPILLRCCLVMQYNDSMASDSESKTMMHCVQGHTQIGYFTVVFSVHGHTGKFNETHQDRFLSHKWCLVELLITMERRWTVPARVEKKRKGHAETSSHGFLHKPWTQQTGEDRVRCR